MYFSFDNYRTVHDILSYTYVGKKDPFDITKTNMCFCKREKIKQQSLSCNFKGTMNLNLCKNFSLIVSYPHFYLGDSKLSQYTQGLTPMRELHESFISLEPVIKTRTLILQNKRIYFIVEKWNRFELCYQISIQYLCQTCRRDKYVE
jgi:hypothetical protein